jgi:cell division inhibitor SepF
MRKQGGNTIMSAGILNKALDFLGFEVEEEVLPTNETPSREERNPISVHQQTGTSKKGVMNGKVVNIHTQQQFKVVIMNPENFEDAREITEHLRNKKPVVINLLELEKDFAQRILDFLSGTLCALDGNIQKVSQGIFIVAPNTVDVMGDFKDELKNKSALFPWIKG